jgi:uncharacterized membrane protein
LADHAGTGFEVLVLLHVLCVIGGFGALMYNGLYLTLAQQRPGGGTSAVLDVNRLVSALGELLVYASFLFGIGAVAASGSSIRFGDPWVSAAIGVYVALVGILHGWLRPNQRRHAEVVHRLETPEAVAGGSGAVAGGSGAAAGGSGAAAGGSGAAAGGSGAVAGGRQADVALLKALERKVGAGWAVFDALVIGVVYLMVFRPGG